MFRQLRERLERWKSPKVTRSRWFDSDRDSEPIDFTPHHESPKFRVEGLRFTVCRPIFYWLWGLYGLKVWGPGFRVCSG